MPRFFVENDAVRENEICLSGENAHHVARSLRMAVQDTLIVCDTRGTEYDCRIRSFEDDRLVHLEILARRDPENEPPSFIRLFQALPKGDKLETVIQKAVECGASEIIPFESERCVVRVKPEAEDRKTERRRKIAEEAAKQCGRGRLPAVSSTVSFSDMLRMAAESEVCLFCYEGKGTRPLGQVLSDFRSVLREGCRVSVIVGSEGGFSPSEVEAASEAGLCPVGLGSRILRTETAPVFVLSCLSYVTELFGFEG
jgi:16S rRNA (uracil1498-N3)-methyltransferase